jgi:glutathione reductase (NADPH)
MPSHDYDLFVIGGGSGGVRAARVAAEHGAKVAIAEADRFGGTCVIRGCIPKKLLLYASRFKYEFADAAGFGWSVGETRFDWRALLANKDREIARLESVYRTALEKAGVAIFAARASLADRHTVVLHPGNRTVSARTILIATGGHPQVPDVPGAEHAITSDDAFHLDKLPNSVLIVGGGYIAAEFASIFCGLGVATTIAYRGHKILRGFDEDLRDGLSEEMVRRGIEILLDADVAAIAREGSSYRVTFRDGRSLATGLVMFATGRRPNTSGLGLQAAGVELGWNGKVVVDESLRTSVDNIYAIGDVTHRLNLTPVAIREGQAFADSVFADKPTSVSREFVPTAVFATPEIGTVGLPEHLARERCARLDVYKSLFKPLRHTLSGRDQRTLMKLLVDGESGRVVGCHVLGEDAAEIVQMAAVALRLGATKADFDATMALHPTAAEELLTMREKWTPAMAAQ